MIDIPGCSERTNFKTNNVFNISKERDHKKLISRHFALNGNRPLVPRRKICQEKQEQRNSGEIFLVLMEATRRLHSPPANYHAHI